MYTNNLKNGNNRKLELEQHTLLAHEKSLDNCQPKRAKIEVNIEEIFSRFPHIGEQIFEKLSNQSLTKCRKVNHNWQEST